MLINSMLLKQLSKQVKSTQVLGLVKITQRGIKDPVRFNPEDANKINKLDLAAYFDDFMRRRPQSTGGYIKLAKENFKKMVDRSQHETDLKTLVYAYANYLGHRNLIPQVYLDAMLLKALELGHPESMFEMIHLHSELIYHPSKDVLQKYFDYFLPTYDKLKLFFDQTKGNSMLQLPENFHATIIDKAYENKDKKTVVAAYLEILDYKNKFIGRDQLFKVLECMEYEDAIDHQLVEQIGQVAKDKGCEKDTNIKLLQAVYYWKIKGYLTVSDIIKEIRSNQDKVVNSETLKRDLFSKMFGDEGQKLDQDIKTELTNAARGIRDKLDLQFYGLEDKLKEEEPVIEKVIEEPVIPEQQPQADQQQQAQ